MSDEEISKRLQVWIGTALFLCAGLFSVLIFVDRCTDFSLGLPAAFYNSRWLHLPLNVALFIAGWMSLKGTSDDPLDIVAQGSLFESVQLYTRPGCGLCVTAIQLLQSYGNELPEIETINIDKDPELSRQYSEIIPVIVIDGRERFRGNVNPELLERLVAARRSQRIDSSPNARRSSPI